MIKIVPSVFVERGTHGDFGWMLGQPEYDDSLFVFNDNQEQYATFRDDPSSSFGTVAGGGNAIIRPWQARNPPRAVGIPTGANGQGYTALTADVQQTIDEAISRIAAVIEKGDYSQLFFSAEENGSLGTGIFEVDDAVKAHILAGIHGLGESRG